VATNHHDVWHDMFVCGASTVPLTSNYLTNLFTWKLSDEGTNRRGAERRVLSFWKDWLIEVNNMYVQSISKYIL
jgi:hypothetical protein